MAGIGFELKKIFNEKSFLSIIKVYSYSVILSSGPWIISILTILYIGLFKISIYKDFTNVVQFQVSITYIIMLSLIFSSPFQLAFSRYTADKIFERKENIILPSFIGLITITIAIGIIFGIFFSYLMIRESTVFYNIIFISNFVIVSCIWISNSLLLGIKNYKSIFLSYLLSYLLITILILLTKNSKLEYMVLSFCFGNIILLFLFIYLIVKRYPSNELINFKFLSNLNLDLILASIFYNIAIWIDKIIFWFSDLTGVKILGNLSISPAYDLPIFLAYLSIIPAMAIFFYRLEADFAYKYEELFNAILDYGTLNEIKKIKEEMIDSLRLMIREIVIIQGIFNIIIYFFAPKIFISLKIPQLYLPLFCIDLIGVQMQMGFMAILSVLHYINKKRQAMYVSLLFLILNIILTIITIYLGPSYFGYGFTIASFCSFIISLIILRKSIKEFEYETFMLN
ncbi:MAG: exopolysaccharide Pel transporter PelG [Elusimicrobiales bacterium]|nr:exopolysaccharide Pel transporter PelG [Elusimicrobiales bacterium]